MRRKDKQMTKNDALDMLMQSKVISIAINAGKYPYIVPMNYTSEVVDNQVYIYMHCAAVGRKIDLINENPNVGFEIHTSEGFTNAEQSSKCSTIYKSIIGTGEASFVDKRDDKIHVLSLLMKSLVNKDVDTFGEHMLKHTTIIKITVNEFDGKASDG